MNSLFYSLSDYFKTQYGKKYVKLSLDGGFTCPNRDGTLSLEGCIFCSERGSGEFVGDVLNTVQGGFEDQVKAQKSLLSDKWRDVGYIAYLQNFSNSYAPAHRLRALYASAFKQEGIEGLAIGTRPDCIDDETVTVFKEQLERGLFWVELGLQTCHEETALWMNRGYDLMCFEATYQKLKSAKIPVVIHLIVGLPGENQEKFMETVAYVSRLKPFGVKFHMLNVLKGSPLASFYEKAPFPLLSEASYIDWVSTAIGHLDPEIVIHRLTGDGSKALLVEPKWILNKRSVLNGIQKALREKGISQGSCISK